MRFHAILATIVAFISCALATTALTSTYSSTVTVTRTLMYYNATTTLYYSGTASTGISTSKSASTVHSASLTAAASATPSTFHGAASNNQINLAIAGLFGVAAYAIGSL